MPESIKPLHFLLRIPRITRLEERPASPIDTFEAHSSILKRLGHVTIAKFGRAPSEERLKALRYQIKEDIATNLILAFKSADHRAASYFGYAARIRSIYSGPATAAIRASSPTYYEDLSYGSGFWITVEGIFKRIDLQSFELVSGKSINHTLERSRTPSMFVVNAG